MKSRASAQFWAGVRAEIPILIGVFPFGIIYGVLAIKAGLPPLAAMAMSSILFAGSSQFMAIQLIAAGTPLALVVGSVVIINLRHMLYSITLAPYLKRLSRGWKAGLAYLLTDEAFAVAVTGYEEDGENPFKHWYMFGAGFLLWFGWQVSTALGIFLGAQVPASWNLDFALVVTFIGLVVPGLKDKPMVAAAFSGGITALVTAGIPNKLGLILAAVVGIGVGMLLEKKEVQHG